MKKYKTGIVLGGGGSRGFAHLGVIKALAEKGIKPDIISGVSAGSIAGSLIADGKTPDEALCLIKQKGFFNYTRVRYPRVGFFSLDGLKKQLGKIYSVKKTEDLSIPFFAALSNFNTGKIEYRNSGPLLKMVIASSSIPIMFKPVELNGQYYFDGGLLDNLPIAPLIGICDKIIAVNLIPVKETAKIKGIKHIISRVLDLTVNSNLSYVKSECDLFIEPPELIPHAYLSNKKAKEIFDIGYRYVKEMKINL